MALAGRIGAMAEQPPNENRRPGHISQSSVIHNLVTYLGGLIALATGIVAVGLMGLDLFPHGEETNPYRALVTYLVIPIPLLQASGWRFSASSANGDVG